MRRLTDTSPEAERVLAAAYRAMSPARKWQILGECQRTATNLHAAGVRLRKPAATPRQIHDSWVAATLGDGPWTARAKGLSKSLPSDQLDVVREVIGAFVRLDIAYALGGSLASSVYGSPRFTLDADLAVEPFPGKEAAFASGFGPDYDMRLAAVEQAVRERSSFHVIKPASGFKVDVFVRKDRDFERSILARWAPSAVLGPDQPPVDLVSPEDIILLKLEWYRLGNEVSERQWLDFLGVLRVQADRLDAGYLDHWAAELGVADLLASARAEAEIT